MICKSCRGGKCDDESLPTVHEPLKIRGFKCTVCKGKDEQSKTCQHCRGSGLEPITSCPMQCLTHEALDAVECAGFAEKGAWPVAGGVLDQTDAFMKACQIVWATEAELQNGKAEL